MAGKEFDKWKCTTRRIRARLSGKSALKPLSLSVTAAAEALGVTRKTLSDLLNGHTRVSLEMAIRLEKVFGSTADTWIGMQMQYDLWEKRQRSDKITPREALPLLPRASPSPF